MVERIRPTWLVAKTPLTICTPPLVMVTPKRWGNELTVKLAGRDEERAHSGEQSLVEMTGRYLGRQFPALSGQSVTLLRSSVTPLEQAEIVFNGAVIASIPFTGERTSLSFERSFQPNESGWCHVRNGSRRELPMDIDCSGCYESNLGRS